MKIYIPKSGLNLILRFSLNLILTLTIAPISALIFLACAMNTAGDGAISKNVYSFNQILISIPFIIFIGIFYLWYVLIKYFFSSTTRSKLILLSFIILTSALVSFYCYVHIEQIINVYNAMIDNEYVKGFWGHQSDITPYSP